MSDLNHIQTLENEAIHLAQIGASKNEISATITEMMTATKRWLGETNSYFDDNNKE